ncbi:AAA family ATPase [Chitinophaga agrisoli]|uniref:AAA family ATPase n=1 Tax=Chitinophaga agrisoli TaxID=2607653 RepID=A0A5B2VWK4_9BACT|nr:AAA family ATPase [Chitinophaga agrisoli]KAA2242637.1 AAA family ATPase [Chitinophaga agrisoli]
MQIKKLTIENFRCFANYEIPFGGKTTVLIGKNGTGKTNILTGLIYSLSFPFAKNEIKGMQTIGTSSPDLKIASIDNKGTFDARFDNETNDYIYPIKITGQATFDNEELSWAMVKEKKGGGLSSSQYKRAFEKFQQYYNENNDSKPLPLLVYFSDSFPHIEANISAYVKKIFTSENGLPRNFGYYKWDEKNNCIGMWKERYTKIYTSLNNFKRPEFSIISELNDLYLILDNGPDSDNIVEMEHRTEVLRKQLEVVRNELKKDPEFIELNFIDNKLKKFTDPLEEKYNFINREFEIKQIKVIGTSKSEQHIQFEFADNRKMFFDNLPMGYKRLFSIVFDIAYRSFILNKDIEPTGIVIIDEIELHLHPTLQQEVLNRFKNTFPGIQFIVSTHSPLVISNLNANTEEDKVIRLENEGNKFYWEPVENIYGIDYTTNLMEVMESPYRSSTIDKLINAYLVLFGKKKESEAALILEKLKDYLGGEIPSLLQDEIENQKKAYL